MHPLETARLQAHIEAVKQLHPVASAISRGGEFFSGDVIECSDGYIVVIDCVTKDRYSLELASLTMVSLVAMGQPVQTFGSPDPGDETTTT